MTIFFTSDQHYFHARILEYSNRPFKSVDEMNEALIDNHNSVVKPSDIVYNLGDFSFGKEDQTESILRKLNGQKFLIFGNHDKHLRKHKKILDKYFGWYRDYSEVKVEDQVIILSHYSFRVWNKSHYGSYNLYGHSHGSLYDDPNLLSMDVGVDPNQYFPISFEQVKEHMSKKTWQPIDHHGKREWEVKK